MDEKFYDTNDIIDGSIIIPSKIIARSETNLRIAKVRDVKTPERGTSYSAGLDFFVPNDWNDGNEMIIGVGDQVIIPSGVHVDIMGSNLHNYALIFNNKSGVATKKRMLIGAQVVDADYQGEVHINLHNVGTEAVRIKAGDKLAQALMIPIMYAQPSVIDFDELYESETDRGAGGFGSTGV